MFVSEFINCYSVTDANKIENITGGAQREVLYYENFSLTDVVTPVKCEKLEQLLREF